MQIKPQIGPRFKNINFMLGILKYDVPEQSNTIIMDVTKDIYNSLVSITNKRGLPVRIIINHEIMNIVKVIEENTIVDSVKGIYTTEIVVVRGIENTVPQYHKASSNTIVRQVITSDMLDELAVSTHFDKVVYNIPGNINGFDPIFNKFNKLFDLSSISLNG